MSAPQKVCNRLPARPRLIYGPYTLVPVTSYGGKVQKDLWCVPGLKPMTTQQLRKMGHALGYKVRVLDW